MTAALVWWFVAAVIVAAALVAMAYVWERPVRPSGATMDELLGSVPPETTPTAVTDPLDPSWTPPDGRWHDPHTFTAVASRHPVMIAGGHTP